MDVDCPVKNKKGSFDLHLEPNLSPYFSRGIEIEAPA